MRLALGPEKASNGADDGAGAFAIGAADQRIQLLVRRQGTGGKGRIMGNFTIEGHWLDSC